MNVPPNLIVYGALVVCILLLLAVMFGIVKMTNILIDLHRTLCSMNGRLVRMDHYRFTESGERIPPTMDNEYLFEDKKGKSA